MPVGQWFEAVCGPMTRRGDAACLAFLTTAAGPVLPAETRSVEEDVPGGVVDWHTGGSGICDAGHQSTSGVAPGLITLRDWVHTLASLSLTSDARMSTDECPFHR